MRNLEEIKQVFYVLVILKNDSGNEVMIPLTTNHTVSIKSRCVVLYNRFLDLIICSIL